MVATDDQRRPATIATISALVVVSSFVAGKAGRDAILLSEFSIESLPLFMAISAALSLPIILVAGRLMTRYGPARLVPAMNAVSAVFAITEWILLARYPRPIAVVVFFHLSTASAVLVSGFWSIVNERFDVQTAKRHIGRIGVGATIGGILGGVVAERTAVYFAPETILLVLAGLQLSCAAFLYVFARGAQVTRAVVESEGTWRALGIVAKSKLLRNVGAIVILGAVAAGVLDYVFKADIVAGASNGQLLRSLALFYTATNIITAFVQLVLCSPVIARLGVPRSVATLPVAVTGFGIAALVVPGALSAAVARGAELVTRNSIYRASYELLYAPLPAVLKRPTKVVLDVGADKIGDILGAQLVGAIVFFAVDARTGLLIAASITALIAVVFAFRLPRSYTAALEQSLMEHATELAPDDAHPEPLLVLHSMPTLGHPGDVIPLRLRGRPPRTQAARAPARKHMLELAQELQSPDVQRVKRVLAEPLARPKLAWHLVELLLGRDDVAREAMTALGTLAPRCTGLLVDALLDQTRDPLLRRRLPAVLALGNPPLAVWGLWRGLRDPSFEVRYRCGAELARFAADGHLAHITEDEVFDAVRRELHDYDARRHGERVVDLVVMHDGEGTALEHVFRVLGLVLAAEPLWIALHAVQADDPSLRGTALEYLESILPVDVRAQLWPLLDHELAPAVGEPSSPVVAVADAFSLVKTS